MCDTFFGQLESHSNVCNFAGIVKLQKSDPNGIKLATSAMSEKGGVVTELGECYYFRDDVLCRRWRSLHLPVDDGL